MSQIKGNDTEPEIAVRRLLHRMGFRFRLHDKKLPGTPDIVMPRFKRVIFVHGCFWHGHKDCKRAKMPSSNVEFWYVKIARNIERDKRNLCELAKLGWQTLVVWECEIRMKEVLQERLRDFIYGETKETERS